LRWGPPFMVELRAAGRKKRARTNIPTIPAFSGWRLPLDRLEERLEHRTDTGTGPKGRMQLH
jgi:hypothetical protein